MKTISKILATSILGLGLGLTSVSLLAFENQNFGQGKIERGEGHGFNKHQNKEKNFKNHHGKKRPPIEMLVLKELNLTSEQQKKIRSIVEEGRGSREGYRQSRRNGPKLSSYVSVTAFNKAKFVQDEITFETEMMKNKVAHKAEIFNRIFSVLTQAQRTEAIKILQKLEEERPKRK
jgi:Spy/CpxP family protein refolding chaperone